MDKKIYKIIVCGGRHFEDYELLKSILDKHLEDNGIALTDVEIVSGHCQGADMLGERYAKENGCALKVFPAEWKNYGKAAGPIRNKQMVEYISAAKKKLVVAFVSPKSKGTCHTVSLARKINIPVIEHFYDSDV